MKTHAEDMIDTRLQEYFKLLRPVPRRDPLAAARAKANYLAEIEVLFEPNKPAQARISSLPVPRFNFLNALFKHPQISFNLFPRTVLSFSSILLIVLVLLFGWVGITARAAETALPGDTLYSFKTGIEQVQIALAGDLDKQAGLYLEFASRRLQEIERLVDTGRYQKAAALFAKFHLNIQKALEITNDLAKVNPARATQRRKEINTQLEGFAAQLSELMVKMPPSFQPAFNDAIPSSPTASPTSLPLTPSVTQTPSPAVEQNNSHSGTPTPPNKTDNGSDAGLNKGSENGSGNELDPERPSDDGSKTGNPEELNGNPSGNSNQGFTEEYGSESNNLEESHPVNGTSTQP